MISHRTTVLVPKILSLLIYSLCAFFLVFLSSIFSSVFHYIDFLSFLPISYLSLVFFGLWAAKLHFLSWLWFCLPLSLSSVLILFNKISGKWAGECRRDYREKGCKCLPFGQTNEFPFHLWHLKAQDSTSQNLVFRSPKSVLPEELVKIIDSPDLLVWNPI